MNLKQANKLKTLHAVKIRCRSTISFKILKNLIFFMYLLSIVQILSKQILSKILGSSWSLYETKRANLHYSLLTVVPTEVVKKNMLGIWKIYSENVVLQKNSASKREYLKLPNSQHRPDIFCDVIGLPSESMWMEYS